MSYDRKFKTRTAKAGVTVTSIGRVCYRSVFDGICYERLTDKSPTKTHADILDKILKIELGKIHLVNMKAILRQLYYNLHIMERLQMLHVHGTHKEVK